MDFLEATTEVVTLIKRPDKLAAAKLEINNAINYFSLKEKFARDLVESTITIDSTLYGDTIDLTAEVVRFRDFKYVKPTGVRGYLQKLGPDKIFTPGGEIQRNTYYIAGTNMTYVLSSRVASLDIGYYQYPAPLVDDADTHWILDMSPYCIIKKAAAALFQAIGDEASYQTYEGQAMQCFTTLKADLVMQN